ncbi:Protein RALF-like 33 [Bienertia sinuspersici]
MGKFNRSLLLILALSFFAAAILTVDAKGSNEPSQLKLGQPECNESMGECMAGDELDEFEYMDESETNRRDLRWRFSFISYGVLNRNRVPCSRRGASYYNCRPRARANPYRRGCNVISRCWRR